MERPFTTPNPDPGLAPPTAWLPFHHFLQAQQLTPDIVTLTLGWAELCAPFHPAVTAANLQAHLATVRALARKFPAERQ